MLAGAMDSQSDSKSYKLQAYARNRFIAAWIDCLAYFTTMVCFTKQ